MHIEKYGVLVWLFLCVRQVILHMIAWILASHLFVVSLPSNLITKEVAELIQLHG